jgi:hypothetical protein
MSKTLRAFHEYASHHLLDLATYFKPGIKMTLLIRVPFLEDGDVYISDDEPELVKAAIDKLNKRPPVVEREEGKPSGS